MAGFRGADHAFGLGKDHGRLVALELPVGLGLEQSLDDALAHQRRHAVIAQPPGVDRLGHERVAE